jgi:hypothetical protein
MSDFNEAYNINICKDNCNFICITTEMTPNGYSYYKCSKCENQLKKRNITGEQFLQSEITRKK